MVSDKRNARCRVLLADDNEEFLLPLQLLLEANGFAVQSALSGAEALKLAARQQFDAVILDIRLPDLSGYTLAQELRMKPAYARVPIIGLTGWQPPGGQKMASDMGFDHFFLKPVDFAALEAILEKIVRSRGDKGRP